MEIKDLSGKDICDIIRACKGANVKELKLSGLEIQFGLTEKSRERAPKVIEGTPKTNILHLSGTTPEERTENNESFIDAMKSRAAEEVIHTQKLMDDPSGFEEDVVNSFIYEQMEKEGADATNQSGRA